MSINVMNWLWGNSQQSGNALLLLIAIADNASDDGSNAYPSIQTLAKKTRLSERAVQYLIRKVAADGDLIIEEGRGRGHTHRYTVVMTKAQPLHPSSDENGANDAPIAEPKGANVSPIRKEKVQTAQAKGAMAAAPEPYGTKKDVTPAPTSQGITAPPKPVRIDKRTKGQLRVAEFIDRVRDSGIDFRPTPSDKNAVASSQEDVSLIVDFLVDVVNGEAGTDWLRQRLSIQLLLRDLNGYRLKKAGVIKAKVEPLRGSRKADGKVDYSAWYASMDDTTDRLLALPLPGEKVG